MNVISNTPKEAAAMSQLAEGSISGLEYFFVQYGTGLYHYCFSLCKNKELSEDTVADVFLCFYQFIQNGNTVQSAKAFFYRACRNRLWDQLRKTAREEELSETLPQKCNDFALSYDLQEALHVLSKTELEILLLHLNAGFKHKEIAVLLTMAEGTVRWKYREALKKLKTQLGDEYV